MLFGIEVARGVGIPQGVVPAVGIAVKALCITGGLYQGVRAQKPAHLRVVHPAVHVSPKGIGFRVSGFGAQPCNSKNVQKSSNAAMIHKNPNASRKKFTLG